MFDLSWGEMMLIGAVAFDRHRSEGSAPAPCAPSARAWGKVKRMASEFQGPVQPGDARGRARFRSQGGRGHQPRRPGRDEPRQGRPRRDQARRRGQDGDKKPASAGRASPRRPMPSSRMPSPRMPSPRIAGGGGGGGGGGGLPRLPRLQPGLPSRRRRPRPPPATIPARRPAPSAARGRAPARFPRRVRRAGREGRGQAVTLSVKAMTFEASPRAAARSPESSCANGFIRSLIAFVVLFFASLRLREIHLQPSSSRPFT